MCRLGLDSQTVDLHFRTRKAMPPVYAMTDAYMVTTATHADKSVLVGNTNQM